MDDIPIDVKFVVGYDSNGNAPCSACHAEGPITTILLPETKYFQNGQLKTVYRGYWLCEKCRKKLIDALNGGNNNG